MVISLWTPIFEQSHYNELANFYQIFTVDVESSWLLNDVKLDITTIFMIE